MRSKNLIVIFVVGISLLLSSCATKNLNGDHGQYSVYGKHYFILSSSKNYKEKGMASWYGRGFNRKRTSSGERYNMYRMTAAHKTLPLDSYVEVTNLNNGRRVVVRVNDRGPFVSNRLIDLSYVAAKKLGIIGQGLAQVEVKTVAS
jgi:rare lipoprotein A